MSLRLARKCRFISTSAPCSVLAIKLLFLSKSHAMSIVSRTAKIFVENCHFPSIIVNFGLDVLGSLNISVVAEAQALAQDVSDLHAVDGLVVWRFR